MLLLKAINELNVLTSGLNGLVKEILDDLVKNHSNDTELMKKVKLWILKYKNL